MKKGTEMTEEELILAAKDAVVLKYGDQITRWPTTTWQLYVDIEYNRKRQSEVSND